MVDYRIALGGAPMAAVKDAHHIYSIFLLGLSGGRKPSDESWTGWKPVTCCTGIRRVDDRTARWHQLYWADLHVHTVLTPDAEGEPNEVLHFARDKARLDLVMIENDDNFHKLQSGPREQRRR